MLVRNLSPRPTPATSYTTTQVINIYADQRIVSESIITVFVIFAVSLLIVQNIFSTFIAL